MSYLQWLVRHEGDDRAMPAERPAATIYALPAAGPFDHFWRLRVQLPERHGQRCRVRARGRMNSIEIEFEDGLRHIVSRYSVRKLRSEED